MSTIPGWSNHPRFMSITGSYDKKAKTNPVELFLGKFDPGMTRIDKWVRVTDNKVAEAFPDAWISGGELYSLHVGSLGDPKADERQGSSVAIRRTTKPTPPMIPADEYLIARWDNAKKRQQGG